LGSSRAETNTTTARIKTKQRGPKKNQEQEELSGEEPKEKTREEERNIRPVAFREYHSTAENLVNMRRMRENHAYLRGAGHRKPEHRTSNIQHPTSNIQCDYKGIIGQPEGDFAAAWPEWWGGAPAVP